MTHVFGVSRRLLLIGAFALTAAFVAGCGGKSSDGKIALVAYSTPQDAYEAIIPEFQKTTDGKDADFSQSYGASGEQSRKVASGLDASVVAFSLEPDVTELVDAGIVPAGWNKNKYKGFVTNSVVAFAVRKGNPKHIKTWDDVIKPGVEVIEPNPFTSGGAKWNIMAAYGAQLQQGKSPAQAEAYLEKLFENVKVQDKSAREALATFTGGKGDVLLAYENEAIGAQQKGQDLDYVIPPQTILIQNPVAPTKDADDKAKAFVKFLWTDEAQKTYASKGYRPVNPALVDEKKYPAPKSLFEITEFGGWPAVNKKFFDPKDGVVTKIEQSNGVSTEK